MPRQTKAKHYRRKSRLSRRRRGGMPSQAEVTFALAALEQVSVLCNPSALDRIATIKSVLQQIYPQQQAPVAQSVTAAPAMRQPSLTRAQQEEEATIPFGSSTSGISSTSGMMRSSDWVG